MPIYTDEGGVNVYDRKDFITRRDTNTVVVELEADEVFTLIGDLAAHMELGGPIYLVIESDKILPKEMD